MCHFNFNTIDVYQNLNLYLEFSVQLFVLLYQSENLDNIFISLYLVSKALTPLVRQFSAPFSAVRTERYSRYLDYSTLDYPLLSHVNLCEVFLQFSRNNFGLRL